MATPSRVYLAIGNVTNLVGSSLNSTISDNQLFWFGNTTSQPALFISLLRCCLTSLSWFPPCHKHLLCSLLFFPNERLVNLTVVDKVGGTEVQLVDLLPHSVRDPVLIPTLSAGCVEFACSPCVPKTCRLYINWPL